MLYRRWFLVATFLTVFVCLAPLRAQEANRAPDTLYTLDDCLRYGLAHQPALQQQQLQLERTQLARNRALAQWLPEVAAKASADHYFKIPVQVFPAEAFGGEPGTFVTIPVGIPWTASGEINANLSLFNPAHWQEARAQALALQIGVASLDSVRSGVLRAITEAYRLTLVQRQERAFARENRALYDSLRTIAESRYQNGAIEQMDLNRVVSTALTAEDAARQSEQAYRRQLLQLKFWMGLPPETPLALAETETALAATTTADFQVTQHPAYRAYERQLQRAQLARRHAQLLRLPTLSLYGSYRRQTFRNEFDIFSDEAQWYNVGLVGGSVIVPLFQRWEINRSAAEARVAQQQARLALQQFELAQAHHHATLQTALAQQAAQVQSAQKNLTLLQENQEIARYKFEEGFYSTADLKATQRDLLEAQRAYLQMLAVYYRSLTEWEYLTGQLTPPEIR
ncbi:Outer membrane protein TolC [Catalinimonas alkaloidigena]|uniref:Outer membrane protein TolC n=2 Tax=Catalinimonas alkaloidigena TaxID=1075417 RepID=A0A1G9SAK2_9BACT|nr:Outer membrane protein TolC [Catalinimonas alkaloidigena]